MGVASAGSEAGVSVGSEGAGGGLSADGEAGPERGSSGWSSEEGGWPLGIAGGKGGGREEGRKEQVSSRGGQHPRLNFTRGGRVRGCFCDGA